MLARLGIVLFLAGSAIALIVALIGFVFLVAGIYQGKIAAALIMGGLFFAVAFIVWLVGFALLYILSPGE